MTKMHDKIVIFFTQSSQYLLLLLLQYRYIQNINKTKAHSLHFSHFRPELYFPQHIFHFPEHIYFFTHTSYSMCVLIF